MAPSFFFKLPIPLSYLTIYTVGDILSLPSFALLNSTDRDTLVLTFCLRNNDMCSQITNFLQKAEFIHMTDTGLAYTATATTACLLCVRSFLSSEKSPFCLSGG